MTKLPLLQSKSFLAAFSICYPERPSKGKKKGKHKPWLPACCCSSPARLHGPRAAATRRCLPTRVARARRTSPKPRCARSSHARAALRLAAAQGRRSPLLQSKAMAALCYPERPIKKKRRPWLLLAGSVARPACCRRSPPLAHACGPCSPLLANAAQGCSRALVAARRGARRRRSSRSARSPLTHAARGARARSRRTRTPAPRLATGRPCHAAARPRGAWPSHARASSARPGRGRLLLRAPRPSLPPPLPDSTAERGDRWAEGWGRARHEGMGRGGGCGRMGRPGWGGRRPILPDAIAPASLSFELRWQ